MTDTAAGRLPEAGFMELLLWAIRRRRRVRVDGRSMEPALSDGDTVLVRSPAPGEVPRPGDVVWVPHPFRRGVSMLKRVASVDERGSLELLGDNPAESTDSRTLGKVEAARVAGVVTSRW